MHDFDHFDLIASGKARHQQLMREAESDQRARKLPQHAPLPNSLQRSLNWLFVLVRRTLPMRPTTRHHRRV